MVRLIHGRSVHGVEVDERTRCRHYRSQLDVIAIQFFCCRTYFPCIECHNEIADHSAIPWPQDRQDELSVLCGVCGHEMTATEYLECRSCCPRCSAQFNPGCSLHKHFYFS